MLFDLTDWILAAVLDYLGIQDRLRLCSTCREFRARGEILRDLIRHVRLARRVEAVALEHLLLPHLTRLVHLELSSHATDGILLQLGYGGNLPHLRSLSMVGSLRVSDRGLAYLSNANDFTSTIQTIDITFCRNTTYAATFGLRDNFEGLRLLRRQPAWMDGSFTTPFEGEETLHTYYADGSVQMDRVSASCGYIAQFGVRDADTSNPDFASFNLQYTNYMPGAFPNMIRLFYRPPVSFLRLNDTEVLFAQPLNGMRAPQDCPRPELVHLLPQANSYGYLDRQGQWVNHETAHGCLIGRMHVAKIDTPMPPADLVEQNRVFCRKLPTWSKTEQALVEQALHRRLGGY